MKKLTEQKVRCKTLTLVKATLTFYDCFLGDNIKKSTLSCQVFLNGVAD